MLERAYPPLLSVNIGTFISWAALLPLLSFSLCVVLSLLFNYDAVTKTHCDVANYFPSISAATGDFTPQKYIWRIGIALHSLPRLANAFTYYYYYVASLSGQATPMFNLLNKLNTGLHTVENFALLTLTYVSSTENYDAHENSFITFMVTSMVYMFTTCVLFRWTAKVPMTIKERRSFRWKVGLLLTNYTSFALAVYFFFRHNWYCEPGMYSLFALCEYVTVVSNIAFHSTIVWDCNDASWMLVHPNSFPKGSMDKKH